MFQSAVVREAVVMMGGAMVTMSGVMGGTVGTMVGVAMAMMGGAINHCHLCHHSCLKIGRYGLCEIIRLLMLSKGGFPW